ncbi:MAG: hypothetical protein J6Z45_04210 [Oscillospiraceae bacterium]|nr:hypothetical protein [Oscillospiraceae bacterium]
MKSIISGILLMLCGAALAFFGNRPQSLIPSRAFSGDRSRKILCTVFGILLAMSGAACIILRGRAQG